MGKQSDWGFRPQQTSRVQTKTPKTLPGQILRFGVVGFAGFLLNACMVALVSATTGPVWAQVFTFPLAASLTWWLNRHYTFGLSRHVWHREWLHYVAANSIGWIAINGVYFLLIVHYSWFYERPAAALIAGACCGFLLNFTTSKVFVFGDHDEK